jgi:hypothetical protein
MIPGQVRFSSIKMQEIVLANADGTATTTMGVMFIPGLGYFCCRSGVYLVMPFIF